MTTTNMNLSIKTTEEYLEVDGNKIYIPESGREFILAEHAANPSNSAISQFVAAKKLTGLHCAIGLPDFHIGYALPIGSIAVVDLKCEDAAISPDGVGFDINCGVRCLKTNLMASDVLDKRVQLGDLISQIISATSSESHKMADLNGILDRGMEYLLEQGLVLEKDLDHTESRGTLRGNSKIISQEAKSRGLAQLGTLGSGNHYLEVEVVEKIFDEKAAEVIGLKPGQIVISIHTGSRGLGHGCCNDIMQDIKESTLRLPDIKEEFRKVSESSLSKEEKVLEYKKITEKRRQEKLRVKKMETEVLQYIPLRSELGQKYLTVMNSASNFAWANRSLITKKVREVFSEVFEGVEIDVVYDVCHNVAKVENIDGEEYLIHRKGASRVLPPFHDEVPEKYKEIGQPVLVGGSMGTSSYLVVGDIEANKTFYSTCHGAGRQVSRSKSRQEFTVEGVIEEMRKKDIIFRVGDEKGLVEECSDCYKDVDVVVEHSEKIKVSRRVCRVKPILVMKG